MIQGNQLLRQAYAVFDDGRMEVNREYEGPQEGHHGRASCQKALYLAHGSEQVVAQFDFRRLRHCSNVPVARVLQVVRGTHDVTESRDEVGDGEVGDDGARAGAYGGPAQVHVDDEDAAHAGEEAREYGHHAYRPGRASAPVADITAGVWNILSRTIRYRHVKKKSAQTLI